MTDTKERIMQTALALFARRGYAAVSVSDIAGAIGITKGALYRHYKNKRDIFDHIIARMELTDARRAREYQMPENRLEDSSLGYDAVTIRQLGEFTKAQFEYWTQDGFASAFRQILQLEKYNDEEIMKLYHMYLGSGPLEYVADMLRYIFPQADAQLLAVRYYSPVCFLMEMEDMEAASKLLSEHIDSFERTMI